MRFICPFLTCLILLVNSGCDLIQDEDQKISDILIGKVIMEDRITNQGKKVKDIKGEFYKDGQFRQENTVELIDELMYEEYPTDVLIKVRGHWEVREKNIYYTYDYDSITIIPEHYSFWREKIVNEMKNHNLPDKIIDYDQTEIIIEKPDGERRTMKKIS
jgi:hypothetical protein